MMPLKSGKIKSSQGIVLTLRQLAGVHQFQVIYHAGSQKILLRIVPDQTWSPEKEQSWTRCVREEIENTEAHVEIKKVSYLPRLPGGKLNIVFVEGT